MDTARISTSRSRQNSTAATPRPLSGIKTSKDAQPISSTTKPQYTVFIRLPFPRQDFEDPPPVEWDAVKDKALWKLISTASNSNELNWEELSTRFNVSLSFLLQQAAWLYERHFDAMRAQMKKFSVSSAVPSEIVTPALETTVRVDGAAGARGVAMSRTGSKDSTAASIQKNRLSAHVEPESAPSTPRSNRFAISRTASTNTVRQTRPFASPKQPPTGSRGEIEKTPPKSTKQTSQDHEDGDEAQSKDFSESERQEESSVIHSKAYSKPQFKRKPTMEPLSWSGEAEAEEQNSSDENLPFAATAKPFKNDPAATLRSSPKRQVATLYRTASDKGKARDQQRVPVDSSESSSSSTRPTKATNERQLPNKTAGPQSRHNQPEPETLSPRSRKSGSEDSTSMGSSFSDLDDVTQSALEDALMSNMQYGSIGLGGGSRLGN